MSTSKFQKTKFPLPPAEVSQKVAGAIGSIQKETLCFANRCLDQSSYYSP